MSKKFVAILIVGALAVLAIVFLVSSGKDRQAFDSAVNFEDLRTISFADYEGNIVSLNDFTGKPMVVNSWAAWCPFCVKELPDFAKVQEEFDEKIVIIAINRAEPKDTAKRFSDEVNATGHILFLLDPKDSFYKAISGFSMPETIFINSNGIVKDHKRGPMTVEEMRNRIVQAFGL